MKTRQAERLGFWIGLALAALPLTLSSAGTLGPLPRIRLTTDGRRFETETSKPFVPFGVNYYRPGTGWAPQVWKKFDAETTRRDFVRMKGAGVNCVRVFLTYGSFCTEPGKLDPDGLPKLDQFLTIAEESGIYVHPTGPDHWEGTPPWARGDRTADEAMLSGLESFWKLLAARLRGRNVIFAYDLRNEPEVAWDTPTMKAKWNRWVAQKYGTAEKVLVSWGATNRTLALDNVPIPESKDAPLDRHLLDYQSFREDVADDWTRRQVTAIKSADPAALVTVGLIQWSVPSLLPRVQHYSGFRPARQAKLLDFLEIHFYPLDSGAYEYRSDEEEARNLAYLESVVGEVARTGKAVVVAEFGWYGGGKPKFDRGSHPTATEDQQARWCRGLIETTRGLAVGWLNWGFYDQPEATDCSELTGLFTADAKPKAWGRTFQDLAGVFTGKAVPTSILGPRPPLDWDLCVTSARAGNEYRKSYFESFRRERRAKAGE